MNNSIWIGAILLILAMSTGYYYKNTTMNSKNRVAESRKKSIVSGLDTIKPIDKTEEYWQKTLTDLEYKVLRQKATEKPFTGKYWDHDKEGVYSCRACGLELFTSESKFDAHCGWPSFYDAINSKNIKTTEDYLLGYQRIELMCAQCGGHLGHIFQDGPQPTGLRYCINSVSLDFKEEKK